jgi:hypothetical protein
MRHGRFWVAFLLRQRGLLTGKSKYRYPCFHYVNEGISTKAYLPERLQMKGDVPVSGEILTKE